MNIYHNYKFCILAAGKGSRNRSINGLHKALLPIENIPVISHIIKKVPEDIEIVIAVGYQSEQIKSYLFHVYPNRKITFVDVKNYDGYGSGPGLSLYSCKEKLQCPFIFTSSDTMTDENYFFDSVEYNWVGYSNVDENIKRKDYTLINGDIKLNHFYWGDGEKTFIGIAGIYDYNDFWMGFEKSDKLMKNETQVFNGFDNIKNIFLKSFIWNDTGDVDSYMKTKIKFNHDIVANKENETIFIDEGKVIKYFSDKNKINQRLNRIKFLNNTTPTPIKINENMYSYDFINGKILSEIFDENILLKLLPFWYNNLSKKTYEKTIDFKNNCKDIYLKKTYNRCDFFSLTDLDNIEYINGQKVEKIKNILDNINWNDIYDNAIPTNFHGDLQPENIIYNNDEFKFIDWRESFGESLEIGDIYYDLSKLYHALLINGNDINNKLYYLEINEKTAYVHNHIRSNLLFLLNELKNWCEKMNYSWYNVKLLGILHYLNISSLYQNFQNGEYGKFLFLYGKLEITKLINEKKYDR